MKAKIILFVLILFMTTIIADNPIYLEIKEGKNNITTSGEFISRYAKDLIEEYPEIESISIENYGFTYGYVNVLGGIGTNILIEPEKTYEIYSKENITIILKE